MRAGDPSTLWFPTFAVVEGKVELVVHQIDRSLARPENRTIQPTSTNFQQGQSRALYVLRGGDRPPIQSKAGELPLRIKIADFRSETARCSVLVA